MDESAVTRCITETFEGVDVVQSSGDSYFFYNPAGVPPDLRHPFATLVTGDRHDQASHLDRPDVFRLNVGVRKETYRSMFGPQPAFPVDGGVSDTGHDYTALDRVMPHPVYAAMSWICVLNPGEATFQALQPLLAEAYGLAVDRHARRADRE